MSIQKVFFKNADGEELIGRLELPADQQPHSYAIFAHCFTCTKNLGAVRNISRSLNQNGYAVLRFDFTGLGESEGDFSDTNFSSNVDDLIYAADFLATHYLPPTLIIGHSLGGAAAIFAAAKIPSINAVATIAAPSQPEHVQHLLSESIAEIDRNGKANVSIGGRPFTIKKQFLDDIQSTNLVEVVKKLRKPLIVLHSPQDMIVSIENAAQIYMHAHHPKSFISLDGVDHLLSNPTDSVYVGNVIANWAVRYLPITEKKELATTEQVVVRIGIEDKYTAEVKAGKHQFTADEPETVGGNDFGPTPYELLLSSLGSCTAMTVKMYSERKKWKLDEVVVHLNYFKRFVLDEKGIETTQKIDVFERKIELFGELDETQRERLLEISNRCPVHRTLSGTIEIKTELV